MIALPRRYEFKKASRIPQLVRAGVVIGVGAAAVFAALGWIEDPQQSILDDVLKYGGGCVAVSGLLAILIVIFAVLRHTDRVIEVDETGLTFQRSGSKPLNRSLKWADVTAYEVQPGANILEPDELTTPTSTGVGSSSGSDDLFGCLFGLALGFYLMLLQTFITGTSCTIKFKLGGKRAMKVSGYGRAMDELIDTVLPHMLPDKRVQPGEKPKSKTE